MKRIFLLVTTLSLSAWAQSDPAAATELFKQARDAAAHGDWKTACPKFVESLQLDAKVGTAINLADCEEKLGQLASARGHLQRAIDLARASNDDRIAMAEERFKAIDKRVPRLTVKLAADAPQGATVKRDAVVLGAGSLGTSLPVDPGKHAIVVQAAGYADRLFDVTLAESETKSIDVTAGERSAAQQPVEQLEPTTPVEQPKVESHGSPLRTVGFVLGGVGLAALGAGAISGLIAIEENGRSKNDCGMPNQNICGPDGIAARNCARNAGDVSTVLFIGGAVLVAGGLTLVLVAPKSSKAARIVVGPIVGGLLLLLSGRF